MAPAPYGTCAVWHLRRMAPAPYGTCALSSPPLPVRRLRFGVLCPCSYDLLGHIRGAAEELEALLGHRLPILGDRAQSAEGKVGARARAFEGQPPPPETAVQSGSHGGRR